MKKILILICFTLIVASTYAQTPKEHINRFFEMHEDVGFDQAIDTLFATNKWFAQSQGIQDNIKLQLSTLKNQVGEYYGYESLTSHGIGTCFKYYTYLMKYERQPLRVHFTFYKAKDKWILQSFKYEDKLAAELEGTVLVEPIYNIITED